MKKKGAWKKGILCTVCLLILLLGLILLKIVRVNLWFAGDYEVRGVDVSHYQGEIDWEKMAEQDVDFAFIKATEGSGHVDERFYDNWQAVGQTDLAVGAYHFFSFDSPGRTQAEQFINTVGDLTGKLPPAVDIEYYGEKAGNPPDKEAMAAELQEMLALLEVHYQRKPIIYTTYEVYDRYIKGNFDEYPLWIRNVYYPPMGEMGERWTFWQYTDREILEGYEGQEKYVDMNVFRWTFRELEELF